MMASSMLVSLLITEAQVYPMQTTMVKRLSSWPALQVHAIETKGNGIALQFEHPTIAGTTVGGWMNRADKIPVVCTPLTSAINPVKLPACPHVSPPWLWKGHHLSLHRCCSHVFNPLQACFEASTPSGSLCPFLLSVEPCCLCG